MKSTVKTLLSATLLLLLVPVAFAAEGSPAEEGFVSLFDGKTLDGWTVGENPQQFRVVDGMIVMECDTKKNGPAHLFYSGPVNQHDFKNFHLKIDVMTFPKANSGIYFHTKYQAASYPEYGLECQVNQSHVDWRRTGSLYGIRNLTWGPETPPADNKQDVTALAKAPVTDNVWYTQEILYQNGQVVVKLDGQTVLEYRLPEADTEHKLPTGRTWLPRGTFALQGHPPVPDHVCKTCFKNIRVKVLPD